MRRHSLSKAHQTKLRKELRKRRDWLKKKIRARVDDTTGTKRQHLSDDGDFASAMCDGELALAVAEEHSRELDELARAMMKLEEGSYGLCQECLEPISVQRLLAIPGATLCITCKEEQEVFTDWSQDTRLRLRVTPNIMESIKDPQLDQTDEEREVRPVKGTRVA